MITAFREGVMADSINQIFFPSKSLIPIVNMYCAPVSFLLHESRYEHLEHPCLLKLLSLLIFAYVFWRKSQPSGPQGNPLPGSPGFPIIGNAFQFRNKNPWK